MRRYFHIVPSWTTGRILGVTKTKLIFFFKYHLRFEVWLSTFIFNTAPDRCYNQSIHWCSSSVHTPLPWIFPGIISCSSCTYPHIICLINYCSFCCITSLSLFILLTNRRIKTVSVHGIFKTLLYTYISMACSLFITRCLRVHVSIPVYYVSSF